MESDEQGTLQARVRETGGNGTVARALALREAAGARQEGACGQTTVDPAQVDAFLAGIREIAAHRGMTLSVEEDFEAFARIARQMPGRAPVTPMFDPRHSELRPGRAFWIKGVDASGDVVHLQAARVDDLGDMALAEWLESMRGFYTAGLSSPESGEVCFCASPAAWDILGRVVYHGEIWLRRDSGFRGKGLSAVLPRYAMAIALRYWQPDFIYGLAWHWVVERRLANFYGYRRHEPHGVIWNLPIDPVPFDGWLVWASKSDMIRMTHYKRTAMPPN